MPPTIGSKRILKRIAPLQLGKMLGVLYGAMGILLVPIFLIVSLIGSQMPAQQRAGMMTFGVGFAILAPVFYGVMGFVIGVIGALIYNLVAKWIGGIEVEVE
ncbi:MAG: hypothetical protein U1G08_16830 [Verrucomicrobiota bacterium]